MYLYGAVDICLVTGFGNSCSNSINTDVVLSRDQSSSIDVPFVLKILFSNDPVSWTRAALRGGGANGAAALGLAPFIVAKDLALTAFTE
jgi:hypothetical protein